MCTKVVATKVDGGAWWSWLGGPQLAGGHWLGSSCHCEIKYVDNEDRSQLNEEKQERNIKENLPGPVPHPHTAVPSLVPLPAVCSFGGVGPCHCCCLPVVFHGVGLSGHLAGPLSSLPWWLFSLLSSPSSFVVIIFVCCLHKKSLTFCLDREEGGIESHSRNTITWKEHLVSLEVPYGKEIHTS